MGDGFGFGLQGEGAEGHAGYSFEDDGVVGGLVGSAAPDEGGVAGDETGGDGEWVDGLRVVGCGGSGGCRAPGGKPGGVSAEGEGAAAIDLGAGYGDDLEGGGAETAKAADDGEAGLVDVASADGGVRKGFSAGDGAVEVVGVGGAEGGDGEAGLGEGGGELGVGVDDGADRWELAIEEGVGVEVRGGFEGSVDQVAVEVGHYHVFRAEIVVVDAGGFDDDEALLAVDAGGVAEGVEDEAAFDEFKVGFEDLFAKRLEEHVHSSLGLRFD